MLVNRFRIGSDDYLGYEIVQYHLEMAHGVFATEHGITLPSSGRKVRSTVEIFFDTLDEARWFIRTHLPIK